MKKTYITPASEVIDLHAEAPIMAGSIQIDKGEGTATGDEALSHKGGWNARIIPMRTITLKISPISSQSQRSRLELPPRSSSPLKGRSYGSFLKMCIENLSSG